MNMNINTNPNVNDSNGRGYGFVPMNQKENPQPWYKLVKKMKGSDQVEVIAKSHASMPQKLEIIRLHEEFSNLIELGALNASLEDLSGSDFKLSFISGSTMVELYYELIMETEYNCIQYDPMI